MVTVTKEDALEHQSGGRPRVDRNPAHNSSYLFTHRLTVFPRPGRVEILGGSRLIGHQDKASIVARISGDTSSSAVFKWRCRGAGREWPCQDRQGVDLDQEFAAITSPSWTLDGRRFAPGSDLEISVAISYIDNPRAKWEDWIVLVISHHSHIPRVTMEVERPVVSAHEAKLRMMATVASSGKSLNKWGNYTYSWESMGWCNGQAYATTPLFNQEVAWTDQKFDVHEVVPAALLSGSPYCFRVVVVDGSTGSVGWAFQVIRVRAPPQAGYCELTTPAVAVAMEEQFIVACHGWTSNSAGNVKYRYKLRTSRGDTISLGPPTTLSQRSFTVDVGHYDLEVDILDGTNPGDILITTFPVRSISARPGDTSRDAFLAMQLAKFEQTRNPLLAHEILALTSMASYQLRSGATKMTAVKKDDEAVALKAGNAEPVNLARVLAMIDTLTQGTILDAQEAGPFYLDYLQRVLPTKLPIDLRPVLLRILLRIVQGMNDDVLRIGDSKCFGETEIVKTLQLLEPVLENPRGGAGASFAVHEIKNVIETCLQRTMYCDLPPEETNSENEADNPSLTKSKLTRSVEYALNATTEQALNATVDTDLTMGHALNTTMEGSSIKSLKCTKRKSHTKIVEARKAKSVRRLADDTASLTMEDDNDVWMEEWDGKPFTWHGKRQIIEFGLIDTHNVTRTTRLCGFSLPDLRGMTEPGDSCLGYRCTLTTANLMRNSSIDTNVLELAFRNATQVLAPWFRTRHLSFLMPLSEQFQERLEHGGRPHCVWYDRWTNATSSAWTDRGCRVVAFNRTHVQCACSHLTEFSILIHPLPRAHPSWWWWALLVGALVLCLFLSSGWIYSRLLTIYRRRKNAPGGMAMGPLTFENELRRRQATKRRWSSSGSTLGLGLGGTGENVADGGSSAASTIAPPSQSASGSALDLSGSAATLTNRRKGLRMIFRQSRPNLMDSSNETLKTEGGFHNRTLTGSKSAIWSRHDDDILRQEKLNLILQSRDDDEDAE